MSHAARKRRQRRSKGGAARVLLVFFSVVVVGLVVGAIGAVGYVSSIADDVDLDDIAKVDPGATSVVYASDGTRLGFLRGPVLRQPVASAKMAETVRQATIAVEDRRFYEHGGVDVEGIFRAATRNITSGSNVEGASTLEMQLIRNLWTKDTSSSLKRKIREAKLAGQLEDRHPGRSGKEWVLTTYLNSAPYGVSGGQEIKGVEAAARVFFDTTASRLSIAQSAMIAGLPQAPTQYNPYTNAPAALKRRNDVLRRMAEQGYITAAQAAKAQNQSLGLKKGDYYTARREQGFMDYVKKDLVKRYGRKRVAQGGLKVYTTLDLRKQRLARAAMAKNLPGASDPSAAVVTLDPKTGNIQAMASSLAYGKSQFELASQAKRQPGSTFKIIVLATALEQGISPSTTYPAPGTFPIPARWGTGEVKNFAREGSTGTRMDLTQATLKSVNTVFFQLDLDVGPENVTKTARAMGVTSKLQSYPSEGIGGLGEGVTPLEMARVYATLANRGKRTVPRAITKVVFPDGRVKRPQRVRAVQALKPAVASEITRILEKDIQSGTARSAGFGCPAGGKTGTSDKAADVWLTGYTPNMATAVWVGYPGSRQPILSTTTAGGNIQGATVAAPIWHDYMAAAHGSFCEGFKGLVPFSGSKGTGQYATSAAPDSSSSDSTDSTGGDLTGDSTGTGTSGDGQGTARSTGGLKPYSPDDAATGN